jgi:DNA polymerase III delta subunit
MGIYFFYGDEDYLIDIELKKAKSKLDENFLAMNFAEYTYNERDSKNGIKFSELIPVLLTRPMMFGKMIIVINCTNLLSATLEDKQIKEFESALSTNTDDVDIYFVAKYSNDDKKKKPDSRRKIFKLLSKYQTKEFMTLPTYKTKELTDWINIFAKQHGLTIPQDVALTMIESIGNNLRQFDTEISKLELIAYPEKTITKDMIKQICISNEDLFNLTDFIIANKKSEALLEMRKLLVNKHPLELLAPIQTMLKQWITWKIYSKSMSTFEISKLTRVHEFVVKKTLDKMKQTPLKTLVNLKLHLTEAEYKIKTGQSLDPTEELENAIIR